MTNPQTRNSAEFEEHENKWRIDGDTWYSLDKNCQETLKDIMLDLVKVSEALGVTDVRYTAGVTNDDRECCEVDFEYHQYFEVGFLVSIKSLKCGVDQDTVIHEVLHAALRDYSRLAEQCASRRMQEELEVREEQFVTKLSRAIALNWKMRDA